ncbi:MAG: multidrug effflux MFS transporter [Acidimicrobiia bacterium]|nr:multidrug effflux MFS transporter [Acidimicrobiia bacterium]
MGPRQPGRVEFVAIVAMIMASGALGIDLMLPAFGSIRSAFNLSPDSTAPAAIVTMYLVGLALGQLWFGSYSDRHGRKAALRVGMIGYAVCAAGAAFAPSLGPLLAIRLAWGFMASGPRVVAVAIVRDRFEGDRMAQAMSFVMAVFVLVPVVAPSLGAVVLAVGGWRWVFGSAAIFALVVLAWSHRLPETLHPDHRRVFSLRAIADAAREVVRDRDAMRATAAMTLMFGAFSSYLAGSELIVSGSYRRPELFPYVFGGLAIFMGAANVTNGSMVRRIGSRRVSRVGLGIASTWAILMVALLFSFGQPPLLGFVLGIAPLLAVHAMVFPTLNAVAMEPMGHIAGTASAVIGTISTALGAVLGSFIDRSFAGSVTPMALGFAGYGLLAFGLVLGIGSQKRSIA